MASQIPVGALQDQQLDFQNNDGKNAFYQQVGADKAAGMGNEAVANKYANNAWGVSFQELLGAPAGQALGAQSSGPAVNPYAAWGDQNGLQDAKNSIFNSFNQSSDDAASQYGRGVRDLTQGFTAGQQALDKMGAQNELAKMQGTRGVLGMVNRGIKSGNTMLANKNASNSSAAGALANAYGDIGQRELSKVGNQYGLANEDLAGKQSQFDQQMTNQFADIRANKDQVVNKMVNTTRDAIAALNAQMGSAGLTDKIAIEQEVARLKNELLGKLQQYDGQLASSQNDVKAATPEARMARAQQMASVGQVSANPFQFTTEAPAQFQNTGSNGGVPLFTFPRNRQQG